LHAIAREKEIIHNNAKCRGEMLPYNNIGALDKVKVRKPSHKVGGGGGDQVGGL
jgi:hypothetical protein